MCDFCGFAIRSDSGIHPSSRPFLAYDKDDGHFYIEVPTADPYVTESVDNIRFCPYCGKELKDYKEITIQKE